MKLPSVREARDQWGITKLDATHHNQNIDNTKILLQSKFNKIVQDIKENEYIIGLNQYDLNDNEIYAIHMMLLLHNNIILAEENNTVKYVYIDTFAKSGLGIKAFSFYWFDIDLARYIRKKYRITDEHVFQDICFILNTLMGYAFRNQSSISNKNIINIFSLANNLFMNMDQFLIALTVLAQNKIVMFNRHDVNGNFKFQFCDYLSIAIDQRLKILKSITEKQENNNIQEKNDEISHNEIVKLKQVLEDNNDINTVELSDQFSRLINYFKDNQESYSVIPPDIIKYDSDIMKHVLRNKLFNHANIIFQPYNYVKRGGVQYEYRYVNSNIKQNQFADYCIYRFVSNKMINIIQIFIKENRIHHHSLSQIITLLDFVHKKFMQHIGKKNNVTLQNVTDKIKFMGNWFTTAGFTDKQEYINILILLNDIGIIELSDINNSNKQVSLCIQLTHVYDNLSMSIDELTKKMNEFYNSRKNKKNINNDKVVVQEEKQNDNQVQETNELEQLKQDNAQLLQEINQLKQDNNQLLQDNTQLLIKLSDYRKFNALLKDIDIPAIKQQIEIQMLMLSNQVNNELNNTIQLDSQDNKQLLQQLNCQKRIFTLINNTEQQLKQYFFN